MAKTVEQITQEINTIKLHLERYKCGDVKDSRCYYENDHTKINARKMEFIHEGKLHEDLFKSNTKVTINDYKVIVDQLTSYLMGKEPSLTNVDDNLLKEFPQKKAWRIVKEALKVCQIQKVAWVQTFINKKGNVDFTVCERSDNIIAIYSDDVEKELLTIIKFYDVDIYVDNKFKTVTRYEYWDKETVTYYKMEDEKLVFWDCDDEITLNPRPHLVSNIKYKSGVTVTEEEHSWGVVPFSPLFFNSENQTALQMIGKEKVDAIDFLTSDGVNNFMDLADVIYILKDYIGPPEEALLNLKTKRGAVVSGDGDIKTITSEIPMAQREIMLKILKQAVYQDGMAVDLTNLTGGSITNVLIEAYFELLDMKANNTTPQIEQLYTDLLTFVDIKQKKYPSQATYQGIEEPEITFNKSIIVNEIEYINASNASMGAISDETRWSYDPRVSDPKVEAERVESENQGLD